MKVCFSLKDMNQIYAKVEAMKFDKALKNDHIYYFSCDRLSRA